MQSTDDCVDPWVVISSPSECNSSGLVEEHNNADVSHAWAYISTPIDTDISPDQIDQYRAEISKDIQAHVAQNAVVGSSVWQVTKSQAIVQKSLSPYFSINLDRGGMPATDQEDSGRCWLFGTLNLFRFGTRAKLHMEEFEFSESYLYFFHLLEQANSFCENVISTADRPIDDGLVGLFLGDPIEDGGDWGIAVNLLNKYGILPKAFFPETHSSRNTDSLLTILTSLLGQTAVRIRKAKDQGQSTNEIRNTIKSECVKVTYRILCIHLGTPPDSFDWKWRDEEGTYHRDGSTTPLQFMAKYVTIPFNDYVSIIQDPRNQYYRRYVNSFDMPVHGGALINFLNLPSHELKSTAIQQLKDGLPVLFACNVEVEEDDEHGLWDADLYDLSHLYGVSLGGMSKKELIEYGGSMGDHIMLITGVDLDESTGTPTRWRIENSWGTDGFGQNGYYTMNDNWFDQNVFEIVTPTCFLSSEAIQGLDTKPIELPPWDPLLARPRRRRAFGRVATKKKNQIRY